ncbi:MAG: YbfB/YjiJ family MFS transporter [Pseudomonadota bacterium]|nr:YbfB/YjiJ family MFS transporter [Pseudomonadota bacterium]
MIGLARFSYALLLPAMRADLGWTYAEAGAVGAANALGYLVGALLTMRLVHRLGNRRLFTLGLGLTALALLGSGGSRDFAFQLLWRSLAGIGAAGTFVCGGVLAGTLALPVAGRVRPGLGITVFFAGGGLGILMSGLSLPFWLAAEGDRAWPQMWTAMGGFALLATVAGAAAVRHVEEPNLNTDRVDWPARAYRPVLISYLLFGLGYIAYMTFIVAWMRQRGAAPAEVALTWSLLGGASVVAPSLWGERFRRPRGGRPMAEALALVSVGVLIPLFVANAFALALSALLVGASVFMVPSALTLLLRAELPQAAWGRAMAALTILFASGQVLGPLLTGWLADVTGSLFAGLASSAVILIAACVAARAQSPALASTAAGAQR